MSYNKSKNGSPSDTIPHSSTEPVNDIQHPHLPSSSTETPTNSRDQIQDNIKSPTDSSYDAVPSLRVDTSSSYHDRKDSSTISIDSNIDLSSPRLSQSFSSHMLIDSTNNLLSHIPNLSKPRPNLSHISSATTHLSHAESSNKSYLDMYYNSWYNQKSAPTEPSLHSVKGKTPNGDAILRDYLHQYGNKAVHFQSQLQQDKKIRLEKKRDKEHRLKNANNQTLSNSSNNNSNNIISNDINVSSSSSQLTPSIEKCYRNVPSIVFRTNYSIGTQQWMNDMSSFPHVPDLSYAWTTLPDAHHRGGINTSLLSSSSSVNVAPPSISTPMRSSTIQNSIPYGLKGSSGYHDDDDDDNDIDQSSNHGGDVEQTDVDEQTDIDSIPSNNSNNNDTNPTQKKKKMVSISSAAVAAKQPSTPHVTSTTSSPAHSKVSVSTPQHNPPKSPSDQQQQQQQLKPISSAELQVLSLRRKIYKDQSHPDSRHNLTILYHKIHQYKQYIKLVDIALNEQISLKKPLFFQSLHDTHNIHHQLNDFVSYLEHIQNNISISKMLLHPVLNISAISLCMKNMYKLNNIFRHLQYIYTILNDIYIYYRLDYYTHVLNLLSRLSLYIIHIPGLSSLHIIKPIISIIVNIHHNIIHKICNVIVLWMTLHPSQVTTLCYDISTLHSKQQSITHQTSDIFQPLPSSSSSSSSQHQPSSQHQSSSPLSTTSTTTDSNSPSLLYPLCSKHKSISDPNISKYILLHDTLNHYIYTVFGQYIQQISTTSLHSIKYNSLPVTYNDISPMLSSSSHLPHYICDESRKITSNYFDKYTTGSNVLTELFSPLSSLVSSPSQSPPSLLAPHTLTNSSLLETATPRSINNIPISQLQQDDIVGLLSYLSILGATHLFTPPTIITKDIEDNDTTTTATTNNNNTDDSNNTITTTNNNTIITTDLSFISNLFYFDDEYALSFINQYNNINNNNNNNSDSDTSMISMNVPHNNSDNHHNNNIDNNMTTTQLPDRGTGAELSDQGTGIDEWFLCQHVVFHDYTPKTHTYIASHILDRSIYPQSTVEVSYHGLSESLQPYIYHNNANNNNDNTLLYDVQNNRLHKPRYSQNTNSSSSSSNYTRYNHALSYDDMLLYIPYSYKPTTSHMVASRSRKQQIDSPFPSASQPQIAHDYRPGFTLLAQNELRYQHIFNQYIDQVQVYENELKEYNKILQIHQNSSDHRSSNLQPPSTLSSGPKLSDSDLLVPSPSSSNNNSRISSSLSLPSPVEHGKPNIPSTATTTGSSSTTLSSFRAGISNFVSKAKQEWKETLDDARSGSHSAASSQSSGQNSMSRRPSTSTAPSPSSSLTHDSRSIQSHKPPLPSLPSLPNPPSPPQDLPAAVLSYYQQQYSWQKQQQQQQQASNIISPSTSSTPQSSHPPLHFTTTHTSQYRHNLLSQLHLPSHIPFWSQLFTTSITEVISSLVSLIHMSYPIQSQHGHSFIYIPNYGDYHIESLFYSLLHTFLPIYSQHITYPQAYTTSVCIDIIKTLDPILYMMYLYNIQKILCTIYNNWNILSASIKSVNLGNSNTTSPAPSTFSNDNSTLKSQSAAIPRAFPQPHITTLLALGHTPYMYPTIPLSSSLPSSQQGSNTNDMPYNPYQYVPSSYVHPTTPIEVIPLTYPSQEDLPSPPFFPVSEPAYKISKHPQSHQNASKTSESSLHCTDNSSPSSLDSSHSSSPSYGNHLDLPSFLSHHVPLDYTTSIVKMTTIEHHNANTSDTLTATSTPTTTTTSTKHNINQFPLYDIYISLFLSLCNTIIPTYDILLPYSTIIQLFIDTYCVCNNNNTLVINKQLINMLQNIYKNMSTSSSSNSPSSNPPSNLSLSSYTDRFASLLSPSSPATFPIPSPSRCTCHCNKLSDILCLWVKDTSNKADALLTSYIDIEPWTSDNKALTIPLYTSIQTILSSCFGLCNPYNTNVYTTLCQSSTLYKYISICNNNNADIRKLLPYEPSSSSMATTAAASSTAASLTAAPSTSVDNSTESIPPYIAQMLSNLKSSSPDTNTIDDPQLFLSSALYPHPHPLKRFQTYCQSCMIKAANMDLSSSSSSSSTPSSPGVLSHDVAKNTLSPSLIIAPPLQCTCQYSFFPTIATSFLIDITCIWIQCSIYIPSIRPLLHNIISNLYIRFSSRINQLILNAGIKYLPQQSINISQVVSSIISSPILNIYNNILTTTATTSSSSSLLLDNISNTTHAPDNIILHTIKYETVTPRLLAITSNILSFLEYQLPLLRLIFVRLGLSSIWIVNIETDILSYKQSIYTKISNIIGKLCKDAIISSLNQWAQEDTDTNDDNITNPNITQLQRLQYLESIYNTDYDIYNYIKDLIYKTKATYDLISLYVCHNDLYNIYTNICTIYTGLIYKYFFRIEFSHLSLHKKMLKQTEYIIDNMTNLIEQHHKHNTATATTSNNNPILFPELRQFLKEQHSILKQQSIQRQNDISVLLNAKNIANNNNHTSVNTPVGRGTTTMASPSGTTTKEQTQDISLESFTHEPSHETQSNTTHIDDDVINNADFNGEGEGEGEIEYIEIEVEEDEDGDDDALTNDMMAFYGDE